MLVRATFVTTFFLPQPVCKSTAFDGLKLRSWEKSVCNRTDYRDEQVQAEKTATRRLRQSVG